MKKQEKKEMNEYVLNFIEIFNEKDEKPLSVKPLYHCNALIISNYCCNYQQKDKSWV